MATIHDLIVDTFDDDILIDVIGHLGRARLLRDVKDPEEPYLTEDGYLVVRLKDVADPQAYAREVQRRVMGMRIVRIQERTTPNGGRDGN